VKNIKTGSLLQIDSLGGGIHSKVINDILQKHYKCYFFNVVANRNKNKLYEYLMLFYRLAKVHGNKDIWIRSFSSTITLPFDKTQGKNIVVIYDVGNSFKSVHIQFLNKIMEKIFYYALKRVDSIIVMSKLWKEYFESRGYDNVRIIYTPFNMNVFEFTEEEIISLKEKYELTNKPIIYLGNCRRTKGVVEAYQALKELDGYLLTSGEKEVDIPAINLNLSYRDYLRLLKASSVVVTMSKFKEGWCRTAHEAMLCKTPVVGSGLGGMKELLEGGRQIICKDFNKLREDVEYAIAHPELGEKGYEYASQEKFTVEYFEKEWIKLISEVVGE